MFILWKGYLDTFKYITTILHHCSINNIEFYLN